MILGSLERIWRYPVKGLRAESLALAAVDARGIAGDRGSALFVATTGHARSGKTYRGKEDNRLHLQASCAQAISVAAERELRVEPRSDGPYFDDSPISLVCDAWLNELEALLGRTLDPLRYRPNLFVRTAGAPHPSEHDLVGNTIEIGGVHLRVTAPIVRCVTTTYDVESGEADPRILRAAVEHRASIVGIYAQVERPGTLVEGNEVVLL
jgi:uncharacterized protein YcbX